MIPTAALGTLLAVAAVCLADDIRCVPTDDNGNEVTDSQGGRYDLSSLRRRPPNAEWQAKDLSEKNDYKYTLNVCDRIYSDSEASDTHAAVWQVKVGEESKVFECGDATTAKITLVEDGALTLTYHEGVHCHHADIDRNTIISLVCKHSVPADNPPSLLREDNCTYVFEWLTPAACPIATGSKGLSWMGVVFLLMFLGIFGYICGGTVYRHFVLRKSGTDAVPNFDMWSNLATSVSTFCRGSCSRIMKRGGAGMHRPGTVHYRGLATNEGSQDSLIAEDDDERLLET